ncbi:hypothetical protein [Glycomyces paridis]|uniref:HTH luxR-type domain-containing protein n=1 Tax=Glycomyces paridis TaxID=2126555 RepID=A0A4S8PG54_9ACTN|nr:hypothetical protein [Glycomyces paridis]THV28342.1 hypothetical protein E9998_12090 [Glycomyces paridis]
MSPTGPGITSDDQTAATLTEAELQVLSHVIAAPNQHTAAAWLGISARHLRRHIDAICEKLGAETTLQMVVIATMRGLVDPKSLPEGSIGEVAMRSER